MCSLKTDSVYGLSPSNIVLIPPQVDAMQASERVSNSWLPASSGDLGVSQRRLTLFRQSAARLLSQRLRSQPFLPAGQCYIAQIQAQLTPDVDTMTRCDVKCVDSLCPALDSTPQSGRSMDCWTSRGPKVFSKIIPTTWGKLCQSSAKVPKNPTNLQINRMVFHVGLCAAHLSSRQTWCIYTVWPWKKGKQQRILLRKVGKEILSPAAFLISLSSLNFAQQLQGRWSPGLKHAMSKLCNWVLRQVPSRPLWCWFCPRCRWSCLEVCWRIACRSKKKNNQFLH